VTESLTLVCPHCETRNRVPRDRLADGARCGECRNALLPGAPFALTDATFDRHVAADGLPLVVDFWAAWCGPCRMMAPAFDAAAARLATRVRLAKLDTEAQPAIASRYNIRSIPTLVAFAQGREVARVSGALALPQLMQWIESNVPNA
jgi:thioredoxin 2